MGKCGSKREEIYKKIEASKFYLGYNAKTNKIEDCVFWYKAEPHPDFKIGSREQWIKSAEYERQKEAAEAAGLAGPQLTAGSADRGKGPLVQVRKY